MVTQEQPIENEVLIQEMLRDAEKAEVSGDLEANPVIHKGDNTLEAPMTVKEISSAGYVWIYDTRSFERLPVLYYMLPQKLRQRRPDGSFRFTTSQPKEQPYRGSIKCLLHPDSPDRKEYDAKGYRVCLKANITNLYQLDQHMLKKHKQEWVAIKEERARAERDEDRKLQRALLNAQLGNVTKEKVKEEKPPLYVSDKDKK